MSGTVLVGRGGTDREVISAPSKASEGISCSSDPERASIFPDPCPTARVRLLRVNGSVIGGAAEGPQEPKQVVQLVMTGAVCGRTVCVLEIARENPF